MFQRYLFKKNVIDKNVFKKFVFPKVVVFFSLSCLAAVASFPAHAADEFIPDFDTLAKKYESQVIEHRRHIHQNPELSLREFKTKSI